MRTKIRELRQARGLSQEELAAMVGCARTNITRLEAGKFNATLKLLTRIADALSVGIADLFPSDADDPDFLLIIQVWKALSPEHRRAAAMMLGGLAGSAQPTREQ